MNIQVTPHTIAITINTNINAGEYNITPCEFTFTEEYEDLTKEAIFSSCDGSVFKVSILNNQCTIPYEVLQQEGNVLLGVYAYETNDDELVLRYSPTPQYFNVKRGSFQVGNDPDLPSPTEWERVLEQINQAIEETNNLNITATKEGKVTTVTITKKDGTTQEVKISDGKDLEFNWEGTSLGVRQEGQSEYDYTDLKGATGDTGATPNIQIGDVQTGDTSEVTRTGTDENPIFNFTLEKGDTGNGIASITKTSTSGLVDTYTITFTNGQTTTYQITNGANGSVVDVQVDGTSVVDNGIANIVGISEIKQELEDMYNLLPKVSGTGETITLDGTVAGKMLVDLKGNTSQVTTTGKNLFNIEGRYETGTGITYTKNDDGSYTLNGTANGNNFLRGLCYLNEQHTISYTSNTTNANVIIRTRTGTPSAQTGIKDQMTVSSTSGSLTSSKQFDFVEISIVNGTTLNNFKIYIQLEKGSSATTFEPYTNGASPNPDYPQDIHVVSGDNTLNVCGRNLGNPNTLFDEMYNSYVAKPIKTIVDNRNVINFSTYYSHNKPLYVTKYKENTQYTFRLVAKTADSTLRYLYIIVQYTDETSSSASIPNQGTSWDELRIVSTANKTIKDFYFSYSNAGYWYIDEDSFNIIEGDTTDYEPYQGATYSINLGVENLFDKDNANDLNAYISAGGTITANTLDRTIWLPIKTNTNYTFQMTQKALSTSTSQDDIRITLFNTQPIIGATGTIEYSVSRPSATSDYYLEKTFNSGNNTYVAIKILNIQKSSYDDTIATLQIEEGTKANSYTPYGTTPIELCKIEDYQDKIVKDNGKWYLEKQIGKAVLNGSENWGKSSSTANTLFYLSGTIPYKNGTTSSSTDLYCNNFEGKIVWGNNVIGCELYVNNSIRFGLTTSSTITTLEQWKTWLSTHNTEVYYVLATPTYTEITDSTLLSQLEIVKRSYDGQTNISQVNNDKPFILDVTALKQLTE